LEVSLAMLQSGRSAKRPGLLSLDRVGKSL
jgi:hypothetical protein